MSRRHGTTQRGRGVGTRAGANYRGKGLEVVVRCRPFNPNRGVPVERNEGELGVAVEAALGLGARVQI